MNSLKLGLFGALLTLLALATAACSAWRAEAEPAAEPKEMPLLTSEPPLPTAVRPASVVLPDLGEAPEITNEVWVNSEEPVTLVSQRGKVVLLEFWTFG